MRKWDDLTDEERDSFYKAVNENCGDMYWCDRVWSGWSYGTMTQYDFHPAEECDDFICEVAKAVYERALAMKAVEQPLTNVKTPQEAPPSGEIYCCRRCGAEMNSGEGRTFTVCSKCWDEQ